ncbi:uncharacterized protein LOC110926785 isoform X1 [Helianthus annuus]|uniref:uncharacterized protein LOC110883610 isoform X1 n=1 Tax=Helianthus annuus TaxID=4232 RepID=UPI000B9078F4|nr:uncharacterized protein LOC110883610 isoform X1 [Helianthus annuus]XP_022026166.1 uncharacterized protein LOC110926785 isoform X1 [Helianthus annuus]XP_035834703.1 uncharacterized protein LOC110883610 isoform X1 [Helianthus annuus]XP_035837508.1 uncharacterized protein LOC110870796 isoform X1 [Helianthus annuus]XP_035837509.1 uncharacterized protein LOC110870796 isoform X1 [Helianthus annuus]XP_035839254.1 uncharacterized protein LOC118486705 isoform X1 [Helianthus annuus]XP_035839256.1 un
MDISDDFVDIYEDDQPAKKVSWNLGFDAMTPKKNQICSPMKDSPKTDSGSVEIISYGQYFSPFKSEMHREVIEQFQNIEKQAKRKHALLTWKWDEVIDITQSEDSNGQKDASKAKQQDDLESELSDTADSLDSPLKRSKIPRISKNCNDHVGWVEF